MRDIKTLLKLMRRKLIWYMIFEDCLGLCAVSGEMVNNGLMSYEEAVILDAYLEGHKPIGFWGYWWHPGEILPRYRFLSRLIREL
jgi:hypothetical protein